VHRPTRISISRLAQYSENSAEFSLSNADKEQLAKFQLGVGFPDIGLVQPTKNPRHLSLSRFLPK